MSQDVQLSVGAALRQAAQAPLSSDGRSLLVAPVLAANLRRDALDSLDINQSMVAANDSLRYVGSASARPPRWLRLDELPPIEKDKTDAPLRTLAALLAQCHRPGRQLLFLVLQSGGKAGYYLGLRSAQAEVPLQAAEMSALQQFATSQEWPMNATALASSDDDARLSAFLSGLNTGLHAVALTGVPQTVSADYDLAQALSLYSGNAQRRIALVVFCDPVAKSSADEMTLRCHALANWCASLAQTQQQQGTSKGWQTSTTRGGQEGGGKHNFGIGFKGVNLNYGYQSNDTRSWSTSSGESGSVTQNSSWTLYDHHAGALGKHLEAEARRFKTASGSLWSVGAYVLSDSEAAALSAAKALSDHALSAQLIAPGQAVNNNEDLHIEPLRAVDITPMLGQRSSPYSSQTGWQESFGQAREPQLLFLPDGRQPLTHLYLPQPERLRTCLTTGELLHYVNVPRRPLNGVRRRQAMAHFDVNPPETTGEASAQRFGVIVDQGRATATPYLLSANALSRHVLVCGTTGGGKTNTIMALLNALPSGTPWLVVEPAKQEYINQLAPYWNALHPQTPVCIAMPGGSNAAGLTQLSFNPLHVPRRRGTRPNIDKHVGLLMNAFKIAFPESEDAIAYATQRLLEKAYSKTHWDCPTKIEGKFPTLGKAFEGIEEVVRDFGYAQENSQNLRAALNRRNLALTSGALGQLLDTDQAPDWRALFDRPAIVNLSQLRDEKWQKFVAALLLLLGREYRELQGESNALRHLTVIEEAHNLMPQPKPGNRMQEEASSVFANLLKEMRAYGEGYVVVDQMPSALVADVFANTGTKIAHKLAYLPDAEAMGNSMGGLQESDLRCLSALNSGQAFIVQPGQSEPRWVLVDKVKQ